MRVLKFFLIGLLVSLLLSACDSTEKATKSSQPFSMEKTKNINADVQYKHKTKEIVGVDFTIKLKSVEKKQDIEENNAVFIFAELTNSSKNKTVIPQEIWDQYLLFSPISSTVVEPLYPTVLTKKDLDGSKYKTALDNMSKKLEAGQTIEIGSFYMLKSFPFQLTIFNSEQQKIMEIKINSENF